MITIWKFELPIQDNATLQMPRFAEPICVRASGGRCFLWAEVDTGQEKTNREFRIYGTGHPIPEDFEQTYIGTVFFDATALVFHVYEVDNYE